MTPEERAELREAVRRRQRLPSGWRVPEFDGAGDGHAAARYSERRYISSGGRIVEGGRVRPRPGAA